MSDIASGMHSTKYFKIIFCIVLFTVCAGICYRIWWVNTNSLKIEDEFYSQNEWIALDGAFAGYSGKDRGGTDNYFIKVGKAEHVSYNEYLRRYGRADAVVSADYGEKPNVIDVELHIKNDGDTQGVLSFFDIVLLSGDKSHYYIADCMEENDLWPQVQKGAGPEGFARPHSELVVHIPYIVNAGADDVYQQEIKGNEFYLQLTTTPMRKLVYITTEN